MSSPLKTPGIYVVEKNAFPASAVAVETAVPVFIGYTEKAERKGKSLTGEPVRISSLAEYLEFFGQGYNEVFEFADKTKNIKTFTPALLKKEPIKFYFYNCLRLYFENGGGNCYILSVGTYGKGENQKENIDISDFHNEIFEKLEKEIGPTLVVIPDLVSDRNNCYKLYEKVLKHCSETQSRFAIFDVIPGTDESIDETFDFFKTAIGSEELKYGAAYYPWLNSTVVQASETNFTNLAIEPGQLVNILPETEAAIAINSWTKANEAAAAAGPIDEEKLKKQTENLHKLLLACSPIYLQVMNEIRNRLNLLPPSAAIAGICTLTDNSKGVWTAPANVSLSAVSSPTVAISSEQQERMNVDISTGKSINAIRSFIGEGCLVWGARTLDGNSPDWRYINVCRTIIMIEQSLKLACRAYVFEPNESATWLTVKSMMDNFLNNLWKQGGLAGGSPEQAFDVQIGLGATMTPTDILNGFLRVTIKLAIVRPAEFIVLTFEQQQQKTK